jgi:hypothetical protein
MRQSLLYARIALKAGIHPPSLLAKMMAGTEPWPDRCLIWTGAKFPGGLVKDGPDINYVQPRARILGNQLLPRYLLEILHGPHPRFICTCGNTLCINPAHWTFREPQDPEVYIIPTDADWTFDEVDEIISMYLANNKRPLDPLHPLLQDIPPEWLERFQHHGL